GLSFSAMRRFITPVLLDSSVSKTDFTVIPVSRSKSFRIGSEKTWSSLTYTTTVRELVGRHEVRIGISATARRTPIQLRIIFFRPGEPPMGRACIGYLPAKLKSSNNVTLSAFVHTPTFPAFAKL